MPCMLDITKNTDVVALVALGILLIGFTIFAVVTDWRNRKAARTELDVEVIRGDASMSSVYTTYGATIASFLVLINNAVGIEGHKVVAILISFFCITYLFYFSSWFRNSWFFPLKRRMRKD